jgi:hypothetical protein
VTTIFKAFTELNGGDRQICNTVVLFAQSFFKLHEVVKSVRFTKLKKSTKRFIKVLKVEL